MPAGVPLNTLFSRARYMMGPTAKGKRAQWRKNWAELRVLPTDGPGLIMVRARSRFDQLFEQPRTSSSRSNPDVRVHGQRGTMAGTSGLPPIYLIFFGMVVLLAAMKESGLTSWARS